jgi:hypothetical protein
MCVLVGMPVIPVVPAMAVEKADAKKAEAAGVRSASAQKTELTAANAADAGKKTDTKSSSNETGGSKAAAIVKDAISKSSDSGKKVEVSRQTDLKKAAESAKKQEAVGAKPAESAKKLEAKPVEKAKKPEAKPVESAKKVDAKPVTPEITGSKAAAVVKEALSNSRETAKSPAKADAKTTEPAAKAKGPIAKATKSTKKGSGSTAKVTESDVIPPVAPAIRPGGSAGGPSIKAADDAAFARQFVQSNSNSAKPASSAQGAQLNADNQGSRIARPGMPAPGSGSNASLDNQSLRIARPGMPVGGSGAGGQGTANGASGTASAPGTASGAPEASGAAGAASAPPAKASDVPPPLAPPVTTGGTASQVPKAPNANIQDEYPAVGSLEQVTFGTTNPGSPIEKRISTLESAIFAKTYETESLFDRTERLKRTLMGQSETDGGGSAPGAPDYGGTAGGPPTIPGAPFDPTQALTPDAAANLQALADLAYLEEFADKPENRKQEPSNVIEGFAAEVVNFERRKRGLPPLETDIMLTKMAKGHVVDLHNDERLEPYGFSWRQPRSQIHRPWWRGRCKREPRGN